MMNNVYRRKIKIVEDTINEIINNIEYNGYHIGIFFIIISFVNKNKK